MTESYKDLLQELETLSKKVEEARKIESAAAIEKVRAIVADFGLTEEQIFPKGRSTRASSGETQTVAPKYRNPETGQTWTGRGKPPLWIKDKDRAQFAI